MAAVQQDGAEFKTDVGFYADTCDKNGENCLVTELTEGTIAHIFLVSVFLLHLP